MCIKLRRYYRCSSTRQHKCEYLVRCSTPLVWSEDLVRGLRDQPCLADLETIEEWYHEPCPDCTGEIALPKTDPVTVMQNFKVVDDNHLDYYDVTAAQNQSYSTGGAVDTYTQHLAYWIFSYLYGPDSGFDHEDPFRKEDGSGWVDGAVMERQVAVLGELICQVRPEHGCPWRMVRLDRWSEEGQEMREGQLDFLPTRGCDCLATQEPLLCNWALHIRRTVSSEIYRGMADPELNEFELDRHEMKVLYETQETVLKRHEELQKRVLDKGYSVLGRVPVLETVRTRQRMVYQRTMILTRDSFILTTTYAEQVADPGDKARFWARASLASWVIFILSRDVGLTTARARAILVHFIIKVVMHDPDWRSYRPRIMDRNACKRLAHVANTYPADVERWVHETLAPLRHNNNHNNHNNHNAAAAMMHDIDELLHDMFNGFATQDRARASRVRRGVVRATEAELDELRRRGDDTCVVCLERFDDHACAADAYRLPVQHWRCYRGGHAHWCAQPCLVRSARTLHGAGLAAPAPRCPVCRAEFDQPGPGDAVALVDERLVPLPPHLVPGEGSGGEE